VKGSEEKERLRKGKRMDIRETGSGDKDGREKTKITKL